MAHVSTAQLALNPPSKKKRIHYFLNPANKLYAVWLNILLGRHRSEHIQVKIVKAGDVAPKECKYHLWLLCHLLPPPRPALEYPW